LVSRRLFYPRQLILGHPNCPSGHDESSKECGAARKLLDLPPGLFGALGCLAAGIVACLIFCMIGIMRRNKKTPEPHQQQPHQQQQHLQPPPPNSKHLLSQTSATMNGTYTLPKTNGHDTLNSKKDALFYANHDS